MGIAPKERGWPAGGEPGDDAKCSGLVSHLCLDDVATLHGDPERGNRKMHGVADFFSGVPKGCFRDKAPPLASGVYPGAVPLPGSKPLSQPHVPGARLPKPRRTPLPTADPGEHIGGALVPICGRGRLMATGAVHGIGVGALPHCAPARRTPVESPVQALFPGKHHQRLASVVSAWAATSIGAGGHGARSLLASGAKMAWSGCVRLHGRGAATGAGGSATGIRRPRRPWRACGPWAYTTRGPSRGWRLGWPRP